MLTNYHFLLDKVCTEQPNWSRLDQHLEYVKMMTDRGVFRVSGSLIARKF